MFDLWWNPREVCSNIRKLAIGSEGKQAQSKTPFFWVLLSGRCGPDSGWFFRPLQPALHNLIKESFLGVPCILDIG